MKTLILALAASMFATSSLAANESPAKPRESAKSSSAGDAKASSRATPAETSGDTPEVVERRMGSSGSGDAKPSAGSAVGQTGGPAATEGHTGSTTNSSNSPRK